MLITLIKFRMARGGQAAGVSEAEAALEPKPLSPNRGCEDGLGALNL